MKKQTNQTIKAHLIRSVAYVLLFVAVCVIPFALANRNATDRSTANPATNNNTVFNPATAPPSVEGVGTETAANGATTAFPRVSSGPIAVRPLRLPAYPKAPNAILYDQYDSAGTDATSSQNFETAFDPYDDFAADDFIVPGGQTWNISEVDVLGTYANGSGPANSFNVFIYQDSGGLPGTLVYSATDQPYTTVDNLNFVINLTTTAVLTQGTYWVSVQANMDFAVGGQWYWTDRLVQSNNPAAWENPGGGFNVCMTWGQRGATCGIDPAAPDQVFRLVGELGGGSPTPTPTATESPSATATPSGTMSPTATPTSTASPSATATPTATGSPSATPTATASGTPTATATPSGTPGGCVRGQGYWKNHPEAWPVTELQLGNITYTQEQLLEILHEPVRGNGLLILAHQLIAAKLNIAAGADPSCIEATIAEADALIGDLVVPPIGDGYLAPRDAAPLAGILGRFNEGGMCAPACDVNPSPTTTPPARRARPNPLPR